MADLNVGDQIPELRVTPGQVPAAPLRGRLGRLQPDPHRPRVRQGGRPAEHDPPRPLHDGPGRPGQRRRRRRRSAGAEAALGPVPRHGRAGDRRSSSPARSSRSTATRVVDRHGRRAGREPDDPQRRGGSSAVGRERRVALPKRSAGASLECFGRRHPALLLDFRACFRQRQELILRLVVDAYLASAQAGAVEGGRRAAGGRVGAVDGAGRAGGARGGGVPDPSAHLGRAGADRRRLPPLRRPADGVRARCRPRRRVELELSRLRREVDEAMRETTAALAQVTDLMALATAPPRPATATIHRVEVLRLQPTRVVVVAIASNGAVAKRVFDFDRAGRPRPGRVGLQLPERVAGRDWASARG